MGSLETVMGLISGGLGEGGKAVGIPSTSRVLGGRGKREGS